MGNGNMSPLSGKTKTDVVIGIAATVLIDPAIGVGYFFRKEIWRNLKSAAITYDREFGRNDARALIEDEVEKKNKKAQSQNKK